MSAADRYRRANPYFWVGQPLTAQGVIPAAAGYAPSVRPQLQSCFLQNRGAGAAAVALVGLLTDTVWEAGQYTAVGTVYTPDTADAQDVDTNDFALETLTVNDGHYFGADVPFGAIGYDISTAGVGAAQTHVIEYWNGTAWTAIAATGMLKDIPRTAGQLFGVGENLVLFDPPVDWVPGGGPTATRYYIRIRVTTVGTTAALAKRVYLGQVLASWDAVAANAEVARAWSPQGVHLGAGIVAIGAAYSVVDGSNNFEIVF